MSFTPGPWGVDGPTHGPGRFKWILAPTKGGKYILIAEVSPTSNNASHPTGNERDANALLVAAAPDLLAALKYIAVWLIAPDLTPETLAGVRDLVRAAIAKAQVKPSVAKNSQKRNGRKPIEEAKAIPPIADSKGVQVLQENLKAGLATIRRVIPKRCTLPQCSCVLLESDGGLLKLTGTDLESAIQTWIGARVDSDLAVMVNAGVLISAVDSLPNERVSLEIVDKQLRLTCEDRVLCLPLERAAEDFPPIPGVIGDYVTLDPEGLRRAIRQTEIAAATYDTRPVLQAINMRLDGQKLTLAAADGFRLAVHDMELDHAYPQREANIPVRAMRLLYALLAKEEEAFHMTLGTSNARFYLRNVVITTHLVDASYPNYSQLIPTNWETKVTVRRADFLSEIRAAGNLARYGAGIVRLEAWLRDDTGRVRLTGKGEEVGDYSAEIDAALEGQEGRVAFNYPYLTEALQVMDCELVTLELTSPSSPGVIRPVDPRNDYSYTFMPMFVNWDNQHSNVTGQTPPEEPSEPIEDAE